MPQFHNVDASIQQLIFFDVILARRGVRNVTRFAKNFGSAKKKMSRRCGFSLSEMFEYSGKWFFAGATSRLKEQHSIFSIIGKVAYIINK